MHDADVVIAGGGIGGLTLALTLHQIGVSCVVLETARAMRSLGVGLNIQPNAVRELFALGIAADLLDQVGLPVQEWALLGLNGKEVYSEPRGTFAGYNWPQYAAHRGNLHMMLYQQVLERLGPQAVKLGAKVRGYDRSNPRQPICHVQTSDGQDQSYTSKLLIGADGIHSAIRAQMHPNQAPIHWGGAIMWRGTLRAKPMRSPSSFIGLGTHQQRMVIYPISKPDDQGLSLINWIAEVTVDSSGGWQQDSWFREAKLHEFAHHFEDFNYDWLDVPAMLKAADCAYENPMIDRDPVSSWVDGPVALMGDAAHPMYPTGSNGASQAIMDARIIGAKLIAHGIGPQALSAYNAELCEPISQLVLRNRSAGPFGLLNLLHERCGGVFDDIETVIPMHERDAFMGKYKQAAGFAKDMLNAAPATIAVGATL